MLSPVFVAILSISITPHGGVGGVGVGGVGVGGVVVVVGVGGGAQPSLQKLANLFLALRFAIVDAPIPPSPLYLLKIKLVLLLVVVLPPGPILVQRLI
jgi:hypothetical protein